MMARTILPLALCLLLANCASTADRLAQRNNEQCAARGLQPNSDAFKDCVVQLESDRQVRVGRRHQEMVERSANPLLSPGR